MTTQEQTFALWQEFKGHQPATLTLAPLLAVQRAWQEFGLEDARIEANEQGPGLWDSITNAGIDAVNQTDREELAEMKAQVSHAEKSKTRMGTLAAKQARTKYCKGSLDSVRRAWEITP